MDTCVFCKIINNQIPSHKVYEDDLCLAFLDINPVVPGHTLLIPKEHHEMMLDTPDEMISHIFNKAKYLMINIKEKLAVDYIALSVNGTDVPHFHIHLIPRKFDDNLRGWPIGRYAEGEAENILERIITT